MDKRLEGYVRFFEDQIRENEFNYKSYMAAPLCELFQKDSAFIGKIVAHNDEKGHIIIKVRKNHAPRLKINKTFCVLRNKIWDTLGNKYTSWTLPCKSFLEEVQFHTSFSEIKPLYFIKKPDPDYDYIGCSSIAVDLFDAIVKALKDKRDIWFIMLDPFPPTQYLQNLINYINRFPEDPNLMLVPKIAYEDWKPQELTNRDDVSKIIMDTLESESICILQGPPGTGKSTTISEIVTKYLNNGKTVCVTTMSNKGLTELIEKKHLDELRKQGKIYKTLLSADELRRIPGTKFAKKDTLIKGGEMLCITNYILSNEFNSLESRDTCPIYDLIVIEEASQAYLTAIAAFSRLGNHCLIVGDPMQLPPIVLCENKSDYKEYDVPTQANGLRTCVLGSNMKSYRITTTYRLTERSAQLTGVFYNNTLTSVKEKYVDLSEAQHKAYYLPQGGSVIYTTIGATDAVCSAEALAIMEKIVGDFDSHYPKKSIAIISPFKESVQRIQKQFYHEFQKLDITVETIDRIQGMTVDYAIVYIPARNISFALTENRFNVATSRSESTTLIISDLPIEGFSTTSPKVAAYLKSCSILNRDLTINERPLVTEQTTVPKLAGPNVLYKIDLTPFERPKKEIKEGKKNYYIIDTNVFVNYPDVISRIDKKYPIIILAKVADELDHMKIKLDEQGKRNAEKALRNLNNISNREVIYECADVSLLPVDFDKRSPDNMILSVAIKYKDENPIILTSDHGLQLKSKTLGISTVSLKDFLKR